MASLKTMRNSFLLLLLAGALAACKKEASPAPASKTDLLTAKNWRLTAATTVSIASSGNTTTDNYATEPLCARDNFRTYQRDNAVVFDEGPTTCNPASPQTTAIPWAWQDNETTLVHTVSTLSGTGPSTAPVKYQVVELTASTLHLRYVLQQHFGGSDSLIQEWTYTAF